MKDLQTLPSSNKRTPVAIWDMPDVEDEMEAQLYWEDFVYDIRALIKKMQTTKFFAYGLSLTWRNVGGYTEFETDDAETLISKLAPQNTDFTMTIKPTRQRQVYEVRISHHDKPMGETMYLLSQTREKKMGIKEEYFSN